MDEIVGRGFHALIQHTRGDGTRYPAEESPIYRTYRQGGANQVDDELFWRKDGSCFASEYKVHPVLKDNRVSGSVIVFSDITERRAMDDKLKHHEFLSDQALGLTRSGYWHVPMDGSGYYNSSKRAVDIFGDIPNDDFRYRIVEDWFVYVEAGDMEASKLTWKKFQDAIEGKIPAYDSMYAYKRPVDGAVVWIRAYGTVARDGKGNASDMYGVAQDVTEYVHSQQALKLAKEAAEAANKAKSAFLANMSHELRTPMNAILGYSEMLVEEAEEVGQDDFIPDLQKINQAGAHLLALINDVLDLSKIESGRMELTAEDYDVNALIDQVALTAQPLMNQNNNRFRIERGERLGRVFQDATKLRQALLNLVSNAAKFTHDGSVTLSIERDSEYGVDWLNFAVKDTGIGIAAEKLEQIFEEFSQADNSTTRDYGGTGLGLTISRRLCQMLGGELSVSSRPGGGSTFTIRVPVALPGEAAPLEVSSQLGGEAKLAAIDVKMAADGKTVLVIDDDAEACEIIRRFLKKEGFAVVTALSGEAGLRLAHQLRPVAITLDVIMPDMDGFDFLLEMRTNAQWQDIPVIVLTAKDLTEEDRRLLNGRVEQELTIISSRPAGTAEQVTSPVCSEDELDPRRA